MGYHHDYVAHRQISRIGPGGRAGAATDRTIVRADNRGRSAVAKRRPLKAPGWQAGYAFDTLKSKEDARSALAHRETSVRILRSI